MLYGLYGSVWTEYRSGKSEMSLCDDRPNHLIPLEDVMCSETKMNVFGDIDIDVYGHLLGAYLS